MLPWFRKCVLCYEARKTHEKLLKTPKTLNPVVPLRRYFARALRRFFSGKQDIIYFRASFLFFEHQLPGKLLLPGNLKYLCEPFRSDFYSYTLFFLEKK
jgi:hypothetical protein